MIEAAILGLETEIDALEIVLAERPKDKRLIDRLESAREELKLIHDLKNQLGKIVPFTKN